MSEGWQQAIEGRLSALERRADGLAANIDQISAGVAAISERVGRLPTKLESAMAFAATIAVLGAMIVFGAHV